MIPPEPIAVLVADFVLRFVRLVLVRTTRVADEFLDELAGGPEVFAGIELLGILGENPADGGGTPMRGAKYAIVHSLKITPEMRKSIGAAKFHPFADLPGPK